MMHARNKQMFTPKEVADELRVSRTTVYRWVESGQIRAVRLPGGQIRIDSDEVERIKEAA